MSGAAGVVSSAAVIVSGAAANVSGAAAIASGATAIVNATAAIEILAREKNNPLDAAVTSLTSMRTSFKLGH